MKSTSHNGLMSKYIIRTTNSNDLRQVFYEPGMLLNLHDYEICQHLLRWSTENPKQLIDELVDVHILNWLNDYDNYLTTTHPPRRRWIWVSQALLNLYKYAALNKDDRVAQIGRDGVNVLVNILSQTNVIHARMLLFQALIGLSQFDCARDLLEKNHDGLVKDICLREVDNDLYWLEEANDGWDHRNADMNALQVLGFITTLARSWDANDQSKLCHKLAMLLRLRVRYIASVEEVCRCLLKDEPSVEEICQKLALIARDSVDVMIQDAKGDDLKNDQLLLPPLGRIPFRVLELQFFFKRIQTMVTNLPGNVREQLIYLSLKTPRVTGRLNATIYQNIVVRTDAKFVDVCNLIYRATTALERQSPIIFSLQQAALELCQLCKDSAIATVITNSIATLDIASQPAVITQEFFAAEKFCCKPQIQLQQYPQQKKSHDDEKPNVHERIKEATKYMSNRLQDEQNDVDPPWDTIKSLTRVVGAYENQVQLSHQMVCSALLDSKAWLTDDILRAVCRALESTAQSSNPPLVIDPLTFLAIDSLRENFESPWQRLHSAPATLILCHENGNHWTLLLTFYSERVLCRLDSLGCNGDTNRLQALEKLNVIHQKVYNKPLPEFESWKSFDGVAPRQSNGYDCGVFAAYILMLMYRALDYEQPTTFFTSNEPELDLSGTLTDKERLRRMVAWFLWTHSNFKASESDVSASQNTPNQTSDWVTFQPFATEFKLDAQGAEYWHSLTSPLEASCRTEQLQSIQKLRGHDKDAYWSSGLNFNKRFAQSIIPFASSFIQNVNCGRSICVAEVMREKLPCKLFVDIEYAETPENIAGRDFDAVLVHFIRLCLAVLDPKAPQHQNTEEVERRGDIIVLYASIPAKKKSAHIIFCKFVFRAPSHVKNFVEKILKQAELTEKGRAAFWLPDKKCIVDMGVYGDNKCLRVYGAVKFDRASGKSLGNPFLTRTEWEKQNASTNIVHPRSLCLLLRSLLHANVFSEQELGEMPELLSNCFDASKDVVKGVWTCACSTNRFLQTKKRTAVVTDRQIENRPSKRSDMGVEKYERIFRDFFTSNLGMKGLMERGKLNAIKIERNQLEEYIGTVRIDPDKSLPCPNIGRPHKSNGMYFKLSFSTGMGAFICLDWECRSNKKWGEGKYI